jgi:Predicted membrane protein (DUF2306)
MMKSCEESNINIQHPKMLGGFKMSRVSEIRTEVSPQASDNAGRSSAHLAPLWLRVGCWACVLIAVAAVIRRVFALLHPPHSAAPQLARLDKVFASHATLTLAHILPALLFVLVTPFFVFRESKETGWEEFVLFPLGLVVGITAYAMSSYSVGGWVERSAVLVFNTLFLFALCRAYLHMKRGELLLKYRWLLRAIAVLLGIAVTRPVMGIFFATSPLTHLQPNQFFGVAFWIGFSISTLVGEFWLRRTRL